MTRPSRQQSLWDAEDEATPPRVAEMTIGPVTKADSDEFTHRYHYSGHGTNQHWRYGLWHDMTLWGIAGFNLPTWQVQTMVFGGEHKEHVAHLSRLALAEHAPLNSESRLLSGALTALHHDHPEFWAVLTYADQLQDHIGWVYQATNAYYTGESAVFPRYVMPDGQVRGAYSGTYLGPDEARRRGWEVIDGLPKHRYLYLLGSKTHRKHLRAMLRLPILPYPKT